MRRQATLVHRWLGLLLGLLFAFLGLTGSLLVFDHALDANVLNRDTWRVDRRDGPTLTVGEAVDRLAAQRPNASDHAIATRPSTDRAFWGRYLKPTPEGKETWIVAVDPHDGRVLGEYPYGRLPITRLNALSVIYELHRTLLSGRAGEIIIGMTGLFLLGSTILGYIVWWPRRGKWRGGVTLKAGAAPRRKLYDWHKLAGVYAGVVLLATAFTGVYLALPAEFTTAVEWFAPVDKTAAARSAVSDRPPIAGRVAEQAARRVFSEAEIKIVFAPADAADTYTVLMRQAGEPRNTGGATIVYVDQYSGDVRGIVDSRRLPAGSIFLEWLFPIHSGEIAGLFGRVLLVVVGLTPSVLLVTGFILWRMRRVARRQPSGRTARRSPSTPSLGEPTP